MTIMSMGHGDQTASLAYRKELPSCSVRQCPSDQVSSGFTVPVSVIIVSLDLSLDYIVLFWPNDDRLTPPEVVHNSLNK